MDYLAMPELWRTIPDLEGYYEASSHGRLRSVGEQSGRGRPRGNVLTPSPRDEAGHLRVTLSVRGKPIHSDVAPLIARAWLGERKPGQEVCHGPAGVSENNPGNLYYGTRRRNSHDRLRDGTILTGDRNPNAKLTWAKVDEIRTRVQAGEPDKSIAQAYGVTPETIGLIRRGKIWVLQVVEGGSPP